VLSGCTSKQDRPSTRPAAGQRTASPADHLTDKNGNTTTTTVQPLAARSDRPGHHHHRNPPATPVPANTQPPSRRQQQQPGRPSYPSGQPRTSERAGPPSDQSGSTQLSPAKRQPAQPARVPVWPILEISPAIRPPSTRRGPYPRPHPLVIASTSNQRQDSHAGEPLLRRPSKEPVVDQNKPHPDSRALRRGRHRRGPSAAAALKAVPFLELAPRLALAHGVRYPWTPMTSAAPRRVRAKRSAAFIGSGAEPAMLKSAHRQRRRRPPGRRPRRW